MTTWTTEEDYKNWPNGQTGEHHSGDRKPVVSVADLLEFETIEF
ncbi:hypothetical protein [Arthrobacter alkaliphilus]|nr:hypothetical protein [Arthrobacter alkaliphilus]